MVYQTLVSTLELAAHLDDPDWVILDCRYSLANPHDARQSYLHAHIPGASFAHLENDLSAAHIPGVTGRHPLPEVEVITGKFSNWGITSGVQVVCYDDAGGALAAARAWWMLHWLGHTAAAVLDGGWQKWLAEGLATLSGEENKAARAFTAQPNPGMLASAAEVEKLCLEPDWRLLDARSYDRYRGLNETIDPVAGHIPGAISAPYTENLTPERTFQPLDVLHQRYIDLFGNVPAEQAVFYCGSGVTAAHNVLAVLHAGLGAARLYVGSWSDWVTDPGRPI